MTCWWIHEEPSSAEYSEAQGQLLPVLSLAPQALDLHLTKQEIDEIIARPEAEPVESAEAQRRRRTQDFDPPSSSHYATMRRRLVDTISNSADPSEPDGSGSGSDADGILRGPNKFLELMDVIYFWALGEAYLQHPQMQSDMRFAVQHLIFLLSSRSPLY